MGEKIAQISTCPECGAELEGEVNFCPECGADITRAGPAAPTAVPAGTGNVVEWLFSKTIAVMGSVFGIILAWIGSIISAFGSSSTAYKAAATLNFSGFAVIGIFVLGAGISNSDMNKFARLGMTLGGLLMLALTLAIGSLASISGLIQGLSGY